MGKKGRITPAAVAEPAVEHIQLPRNTALLIGDIMGGNNALVHTSLRYINTDHQCFSEWEPSELRLFSSFLKLVRQQTWQQVYQSGGKGSNKAGLGYTVHPDKAALPSKGDVQGISPDVNNTLQLFELRVSQRARVHCFRQAHFLFLVWLDGKHEVYPE